MTVKTIDIKELKSETKNARKHGKRNKKAIRKSIERFGAGRSIVIDSGNVIRAGNGTFDAARRAGVDKVLVVEPEKGTLVAVKRSDWTEAEAKGYALADNRSGELAEWDTVVLDEIIQSIPEIEIENLGFTQEELGSMIGTDGDVDLGDGKIEDKEPMKKMMIFLPVNTPKELIEQIRTMVQDSGGAVLG